MPMNLAAFILSGGESGDPHGHLEKGLRNREKARLQIAQTMSRAMNVLYAVHGRPTIYMDRNGQGTSYAVLAYTLVTKGKASRHKIHLGALPPPYLDQLREHIFERWPNAPDVRVDGARICALKIMEKLLRSKMRSMARATGFYFHGKVMRKENK